MRSFKSPNFPLFIINWYDTLLKPPFHTKNDSDVKQKSCNRHADT